MDVRKVYALAGVTHEEGQTGFLRLFFAVLALIFIASRIHPFLSLVDREVVFCVPTIFFPFFLRKNISLNSGVCSHFRKNLMCGR